MAPIATLTVRLSAQIAEFQSEFKDATKSAQKFASDFEGVATRAAAVGTFFGGIAKDIATALARGLGDAIRDAVKFSSEFNNAFIGLSSVARAFGTDTQLAADAARKLSSDGLLPLKDSATGLKNLLAAGFNLPQATQLMNAFKDSAAFGRQGALSFGDAIRSATEGVKNGNSILVDNAGVTKNLSQILKEAGFSAQDLSRASSDAGVRMALFNGILKETRAQTGDAAKLTQTYTGQVTRLESQYNTLLASIGDAVTQNRVVAEAIQFVGDVVQKLTVWLGQNSNGFNLVSDAVILLVKAMSATLNVVDLMQTGFAGLQVTFNETAKAGLEMASNVLTVASTAAHLRAALDPVFGDEWRKKALLADILLGNIKVHMKGFEDSSREATDRSIKWGNSLQTGVASLDGLVKKLEESRGQVVKFGDTLNTPPAGNNILAVSAKEAKEAAKVFASILDDIFDVRNKVEKLSDKFDAAIKNLKDRISGVDLVAKAQLWVDALEETGLAARVLADAALRKELGEVITGVTAKFGTLKAAGVGALDAIADSVLAIKGRDLTGIVPQIGGAAATGGNLAGGFTIITTRIQDAVNAAGKLSDAFFRLGDVAGGAFGRIISDAGNALGALGSLKGIIGGIQGGFTNIVSGLAGIAAAGVSIGTSLRPLLSLSEGKLGALLGTNRTGRKLVEEFADSLGGFDALRTKLLSLGAAGNQLWINLTQGVGPANPEQARRAIEAINAALGLQSDRLSRAQAVLDEYGIAFEQTGEKFRNSTLATAFDALFEKTQILKDVGVDYTVILEKQAGAYSELAKRAIDTNTEIPASMRPILEQLRDMGLLTDKATGEFIDLGQAKWSVTLTEGFRSVTDAIHDLTNALIKGVGGALDELSKRKIRIPVGFDVDGSPLSPSKVLDFTDGGGSPTAPSSQFPSGAGGRPNLNVTLRLPDGNVLLKQFVKGGESAGVF